MLFSFIYAETMHNAAIAAAFTRDVLLELIHYFAKQYVVRRDLFGDSQWFRHPRFVDQVAPSNIVVGAIATP